MTSKTTTNSSALILVPPRLRERFTTKDCIHAGPNGCRYEMFVENISRVRSSFVDLHRTCALGHAEIERDAYLPCGWPRRLLRQLGITSPPPDECTRLGA